MFSWEESNSCCGVCLTKCKAECLENKFVDFFVWSHYPIITTATKTKLNSSHPMKMYQIPPKQQGSLVQTKHKKGLLLLLYGNRVNNKGVIYLYFCGTVPSMPWSRAAIHGLVYSVLIFTTPGVQKLVCWTTRSSSTAKLHHSISHRDTFVFPTQTM